MHIRKPTTRENTDSVYINMPAEIAEELGCNDGSRVVFIADGRGVRVLSVDDILDADDR